MKPQARAAIFSTLLLGLLSHASAGTSTQTVQAQAIPLVGTWQSGNFAYTFAANGTYVYVGSMGDAATMSTQISENGTYRVSGDQLIVTRRSGVVTTSRNYRRDLGVETTVFHWKLGTMNGQVAMQLIFPNGQPQIFYKR